MDHTSEDRPLVQNPAQSPTTIQTLVPELLCHIFLYCVPDNKASRHRHSIRSLSQAPLLLGRVCSKWRTISTSSPQLWSSLRVGGNRTHNDSAKDFEATKYWIPKSGSRPLSIVIIYPESYSCEKPLPLILNLLASQCRRWKDIELSVPSAFQDILFAPFRTGSLPQLVEFDSTTFGKLPPDIILSSAPQLLSFSCHGYCEHIDFTGGPHNIKEIIIYRSRYSNISLADLFSCFTQCPLLEILVAPISIGKRETSLPREIPCTIGLPRLTDLTLYLSSDMDLGRFKFFGLLFLPALISLELSFGYRTTNHDLPDWPCVQTMLARSGPPLQNLRLVRVPMTETAVVGCLSCVPTLTTLDLDGMVCSDVILNALTMDQADAKGSKSLCPWLETVELGVKWGENCDFSSRAMAAMIVSRPKHALKTGFTRGIALKSVNCDFDFGRIRSNPDVAECETDGLKLPSSWKYYVA